jgi:hypothetical protein
MVVIRGAGTANSLEAHGLYSQTCCFIFTSVVSSINVETHRWCYGCHGSISGVMVVMVASVVL